MKSDTGYNYIQSLVTNQEKKDGEKKGMKNFEKLCYTWYMIPSWKAIGAEAMAETTQMMRIALTALGNWAIVWAFKGWQMAMYLSTVKAVMVKTEA